MSQLAVEEDARLWAELPVPALKLIMLKLGQAARHGSGSCAVVCRSWAEAAVATSLEGIELHR